MKKNHKITVTPIKDNLFKAHTIIKFVRKDVEVYETGVTADRAVRNLKQTIQFDHESETSYKVVGWVKRRTKGNRT